MAKEFSEEEKHYRTFDIEKRVDEYKERIKALSIDERKAEFDRLNGYLSLIYKGEVDDILDNIRFIEKKVQLLAGLQLNP